MKVFVTGATGFIGTALVPELKAAGHDVVGLARNDAGAAKLEALGVGVHRGALEDPASLAEGARNADGVVHLAFDHDFSRFVENGRKDHRAVEAMLAVLEGAGKAFVVTSGVNIVTGKIAEETDPTPREGFGLVRGASEFATLAAAKRGVRAMVVRLPQVHNTRRQGLITPMIQIARQKGFVGYAGDGANGFSAAHVSDVARLYRLALEKGEAGAVFHAVDEEHVPMRAMAEAIGEALGLPARGLAADEIGDYFGPFAMFAGMDNRASSALTRRALDWTPTGRGMLDDLRHCEPDAAI
ncbi:MAG: SDR family oxidoreductase [Caulobacteraceae bacterium]